MIQSHFFNLFSYASTSDFTSFSKNLEKNTEKSGKYTSKNWDISLLLAGCPIFNTLTVNSDENK